MTDERIAELEAEVQAERTARREAEEELATELAEERIITQRLIAAVEEHERAPHYEIEESRKRLLARVRSISQGEAE